MNVIRMRALWIASSTSREPSPRDGVVLSSLASNQTSCSDIREVVYADIDDYTL
jgi:hypothetical protein